LLGIYFYWLGITASPEMRKCFLSWFEATQMSMYLSVWCARHFIHQPPTSVLFGNWDEQNTIHVHLLLWIFLLFLHRRHLYRKHFLLTDSWVENAVIGYINSWNEGLSELTCIVGLWFDMIFCWNSQQCDLFCTIC